MAKNKALTKGLEDDCFAIYSKMHHALIDGVAGSRLMAHWMGQTTPEVVPGFLPFWAKPLPQSSRTVSDIAEGSLADAQSLVTQITSPIKSAAEVVSATWKSIMGQRSKTNPGLVAPYSAPDSILNVVVGPQRRVSTIEFTTTMLPQGGTAIALPENTRK